MPLQIAGLTKRYGHLTALSEVSFSIRPGEVLGLIGPNGSGKTTLFECLGGVLPADAGRVLSDGRALSSSGRTATVFYLPDGIAPWPAQTVRWALNFVAGYFGPQYGASGFSSAEASAKAVSRTSADIVRELDLEPLLDSAIGTLSKGQRKRALLAMGLLMPQPVLMADEPFDGLDLRQSRDVAQTLRSYASAGRTMFLSIHQIKDAARVCDRFVLLSGGRVCAEGTIEELAQRANQNLTNRTNHQNLESIFLALT